MNSNLINLIRSPLRWRSAAVCAFALVALVFSEPAWVLDAERGIKEFHHTRWLSNDGAPTQIYTLAQTSDGWLWLGGASGLYRFDGVAFRRFEPTPGNEFASLEVSALSATRDGALWVGFRSGGVSVIRGGRNQNFNRGIQASTVRAIEQDSDGTMWVGTMAGLFYLHDDQWHQATLPATLAPTPVLAVSGDAAGTLWVVTADAVFSRRKGTTAFHRHPHRSGAAADVIAGPGGATWLVNSADSYGLQRLSVGEPGSGTAHSQGWMKSTSMLFDRDGTLWARCPLGICRLPAVTEVAQRLIPSRTSQDVFTSVDGLTSDYSTAVLEDRDGNIWVSSQRGLDRFRHTNVRTAALPRGLAYSVAVTGDDAVWAAGRSAGRGELWRLDTRPARFVRKANAEYGYAVGLGDDLFLDMEDGSLTRLGESDRKFQFPAAAAADAVWFVAPGAQGCAWVRFRINGAYEWCGGDSWRALDTTALPGPFPHAIGLDDESRLWLGYTDNRIARIGVGRVDLFTRADGLDVGAVRLFHFGRVTLIGGEKGLAIFDGRRFRTVGFDDELLFGLTGMLVSSRGDLWLHSQRGLLRLTEAELSRVAEDAGRRPRYEIFDAEDGLNGSASFAFTGESLLEDAAGRIWIETTDSVAWLDPARIRSEQSSPPVEILALQIEGQSVAPAQGLRLPPRTRDLELTYTALSLGKPDAIRFRYRLLSADVEGRWHDAGNRRQAIYNNLGPGNYRFEVAASNADGEWSDATAVTTFVIPPTFTQTRWFLILCLLGGATLLWIAYLIRSRQIAVRLRAGLEERMHERERIARELHDTILQGVQGIILDSQTMASRLPDAEPTRTGIEKTLKQAEQALKEGRDRIRALRTPLTSITDLEHGLRSWMGELPQLPGRELAVSVAGTARALQPAVQDELYRIAREAVANAARHAQAGRIHVLLKFERSHFELIVSDDGRGFDTLQPASSGGHWGIVGMRERAERLSAQFDLQSAPGQGTQLRIELPARRAYLRGSIGSW